MLDKTLDRAMKRLQEGDSSAFDTIYDHTHKVVYFVIHQILRDVHLSEDIMQDTYIAAVKNIQNYRAENPAAWLTTIARNLAVNEYNRNKRVTAVDFIAAADCFEGESGLKDDESFGLMETAERLLDEEDFKIVIMCAVAGYKRREVASMLDMPVSTVTHRYRKALDALKTEIEKGGAQK